VQLLMARVGNIQQLKADVLAQLDAAAERYHRMEACLQAKHAAEVARLLEDAQVRAAPKPPLPLYSLTRTFLVLSAPCWRTRSPACLLLPGHLLAAARDL